MKFNKWTLGLAALGVVTLASAAKADEKSAPTFLETAVSSTTISGYVSASAHWDIGTGNASNPRYAFNSQAKADGFSLDVVKVAISKPLDESEWASGYNVELLYGPDANALGTSPIGGAAGSDFAIKQAYVELRTPVGNGIDWKFGVFDTIIGYEVFDAGSNPNYTRSYGYTMEPTTHTGLLASYKFADWISASVGIANTTGPIIGGTTLGNLAPIPALSAGSSSPQKAESYKTYMGSIALTAPQSWGAMAGSTLYGGVVHGLGGGLVNTGVQTSWYAGAMINTPVKGLRFGASYDYFGVSDSASMGIADTWADAVAVYASYQATDKLSLHARAEYMWQDVHGGAISGGVAAPTPSSVYALTGTIQYDLWKNVLSRLEIRWDHSNNSAYGTGNGVIGGTTLGGAPGVAANDKDHVLVAANLIYKF